MATVKRVTYFKARVEDKPGTLQGLLRNLKEKNIGLISLKGVGQGEHGDILVVAKNPDDLRNEWKNSGTLVEEGTAFFVSGEDKTGALMASLDATSKAGVNVVAIEAVAVGTRYGAILWVDPTDLEKTAKALGAK
ncbi:MAG: hypothetical protein WBD36_07505 [Bacteroidota bacterium]